MSGSAALDRQIAQAMLPRYNPSQAIQQMQRQPVQIQPWQSRAVQNPIFGGTIPISFGLPQASQIPVAYQSPLASFRPMPFNSYQPPIPVSADVSSDGVTNNTPSGGQP